VKVLDFGIVKLTEKFVESRGGQTDPLAASESVRTEANIVMGSPSYMSPEQARGQHLDGRTDIFSLGVVLYEMIGGSRPFEGETMPDVIVSILERKPQPLTELAPEVSMRLEAIITRALAKDRAARYQTVADFVRDLKREKRRLDFAAGFEESVSPESYSGETTVVIDPHDVRGTARAAAHSGELKTVRATSSAEYLITEIRRHKIAALVTMVLIAAALAAILLIVLRGDGRHPIDSVAVLPFANETADQNGEYLSEGLAESLINDLSEWRALKVTSRNSSFRYKGREIDARTVGRELGVHAVLSGRISQRGDALLISIELVDARDDTQVWGQQFVRNRADLTSLQNDIARQVATRLQLRLSDESPSSRQEATNSEAYQVYLLGRFYWNKRTPESLNKATDYFNQAIAADPNYALAYVGLADCYAMQTEYAGKPPSEMYPKVRQAAEKALSLDDNLAEGHTALAAADEYEWKWPDAEKQYQRAIELSPNYATAHHWYAVFLGARRRHTQALAEMRLALELDPLSLIINTALGQELNNARRYDEAITQLRKTLDMDGAFAEAHFHLALAYEAKRMFPEALAEFRKSTELFGDSSMRIWEARAQALAGNRGEAQRIVAELTANRTLPSYAAATVYAAMGDNDRAMSYLEKAFNERSYYAVWLNVDPVLDGLRRDKRFEDLLQRTGMASSEA
jgi:serine/threonine-protein kinase